VFGLVGTLQNVPSIASTQITPVLGSCEVFVCPPAPSGCCDDCAATGGAAKSSAAINASFLISATRFSLLGSAARPSIQLTVSPNNRFQRATGSKELRRRDLNDLAIVRANKIAPARAARRGYRGIAQIKGATG
jgi:hypothetical protein